jgi:hypothetical protein
MRRAQIFYALGTTHTEGYSATRYKEESEKQGRSIKLHAFKALKEFYTTTLRHASLLCNPL